MRSIRILSAVVLSASALACTTILGDFSDGTGGTTTDAGGTDGPSGTDGMTSGDAPSEAGSFAVTPASPKMGILRSLAFTAAIPVTWSVPGGAINGTVDAMGNYHSPVSPGTYQLFATSVADPSKVVQVSITVENLAISIAGGVVAGTGNVDGPAAYAHLDNPQGVAYIGNSPASVIIADTGNDTIRKLDVTSGNVTTVAGTVGMAGIVDGTGAAALFSSPTAIAANDTSNVYVVDSSGTCIRKVVVPTGQVETFTGTCGSTLENSEDGTGWSGGVAGTAQFYGIDQLVVGPDGALYTCESNPGFHGIRRVDLTSSGYTQTVVSDLAGQCSMASDNKGGRIYFNDSNQAHDLDFIAIPTTGYTGSATVVAFVAMPTTESSWRGIAALTGTGSLDDLFFLATSGPAVDHDAIGAAFDSSPWSGSLSMSGYLDGANTAALYEFPQAIFGYSPQGKLFIADGNASDIRQIAVTAGTPPTGVVSTIVGAGPAPAPVDGPQGTARFITPVGVVSDAAGDIYVADAAFGGTDADQIRKVDKTGKVTTFSGLLANSETTPVDGTATTAVFGIPWDLVSVGGILYVVDLFGESIRAVDATGAVTTFAGKLGTPGNTDGTGSEARFVFLSLSGNGASIGGGIATDGTNLYVADPGNHAIRQIAIATQKVTTIAGGTMGSTNGIGTAAEFVNPNAVAYADGKLYISDAGDQTIRVMDLTTNAVTTLIGLSGVSGEVNGDAAVATFNSPFRIAADGIGNLYVSEFSLENETSPHTIRRIDLSGPSVSSFVGAAGKIGTVPGPIPSTVNIPLALAVTPSGDLLFGDYGDQAVGLISAP